MLKNTKIAPAVHSGSKHWWHQRTSALALIFLTIWLIISVLQISQDPLNYLPIFFAYPLNAILGILFIVISLYHGSLGMRVIIEDYIHCKTQKYFYLILINAISIFSGVAGVLAILRLHLVG